MQVILSHRVVSPGKKMRLEAWQTIKPRLPGIQPGAALAAFDAVAALAGFRSHLSAISTFFLVLFYLVHLFLSH